MFWVTRLLKKKSDNVVLKYEAKVIHDLVEQGMTGSSVLLIRGERNQILFHTSYLFSEWLANQ